MPRRKTSSDDDAPTWGHREHAQRTAQTVAGFADAELAVAARDLHIALEQAAQIGDQTARELLGDSPLKTLRKVTAAVMSAGKG